MKVSRAAWFAVLAAALADGILAANLTCYQCKKSTDTECSSEDLKPCAGTFDRCVTHITKNAKDGFSIKRECGLGPCSFDDDMVIKGLGMDVTCDRSRKEYFCLSCCRENGCNKSGAKENFRIPNIMVVITFLFVSFIHIARDYMPPYYMPLNR